MARLTARLEAQRSISCVDRVLHDSNDLVKRSAKSEVALAAATAVDTKAVDAGGKAGNEEDGLGELHFVC